MIHPFVHCALGPGRLLAQGQEQFHGDRGVASQ
jgi:hypothetical protein